MIPCRILVIAPYESMKNILLFICKDRPEVRLTVMVGDLGEGARLVQEIDEEEFDIVISRGGTAEVLRLFPSRWWRSSYPAMMYCPP